MEIISVTIWVLSGCILIGFWIAKFKKNEE